MRDPTNRQKFAIWAPSHKLWGYILGTKACIDNRIENLLDSNIFSTCPHNMVNCGLLRAEIASLVWGTTTPPQQISTGFAFSFRYCSDVAERKPTKLCPMLGRLLHWYAIYTRYTIQPVVKAVVKPVVKPLDNRLYRVYKHSTACQTRLTTGWSNSCSFNTVVKPALTTRSMFVYTIQPVVKPVVQPLCQPVVSCKRGITEFCQVQHSLCVQVLRFFSFGSVTARHSSSGRQPNFAALNEGRHLYSTGRPSRSSLARILVSNLAYA